VPAEKRRQLALLATTELLAMGLWFSASAVVPQLTDEWSLDASLKSWLTMSVQIGFVVGALLSAFFNIPDRASSSTLLGICALAGAAFNLAIAVAGFGVMGALGLRFLTGIALAGVYPPGMKLVATWCREDRGFGIGLLVGASDAGIRAAPPSQRGSDFRCWWHAALANRSGGDFGPGRSGCVAGSGIHQSRAVSQPERSVRLAVCREDDFGCAGQARQPRLSRTHVGAVCDVGVGSAVPACELRECRSTRARGPAGRIQCDRGRCSGLCDCWSTC
jgi:hypothetical protein